jgi:hypothetical protein
MPPCCFVGPLPPQQALQRHIEAQVGSPAIWSVSGTAPLDLFVDGVPSVYEGFVFEQAYTNDSIVPRCGPLDRMDAVVWRVLPDSSGIQAVAAWAPPPPGPANFPIWQPAICGASLRATPAASARNIAGSSPLYSPTWYWSRGGVMQYDRDSLARGKPCPQPPKGYLPWLPGTCLQFTYTVTITAVMERRGEPSGGPEVKVISFSGRLPGIRVTADCRVQGPLAYACLQNRVPVDCGRTTVATDGRSAKIECIPPIPPSRPRGKP